jgi:hypothetical protein
VVVVEEVVLADGAHVGADPLAGPAPELGEGGALPLGRRLDDLGVEPGFDPQAAGELDRGARAVAVEHVVDAALPGDDERHLHHLQIEFAAQPVLDEVLDGEDGPHRLHR